ncbi:hypothetical protein J6590_040344 [Homalodisca vitripennis]|nr:hypothetical protein J6590_040344 [Homalodisca vitripennis]
MFIVHLLKKVLKENESIPQEDVMKWLMEADLNADLNDDEIIEETTTPDSGKTDGDEIEVAASSFKTTYANFSRSTLLDSCTTTLHNLRSQPDHLAGTILPEPSRPPNTAGGWICAVATYGTGEAEEGRESVALRHKLATLCAHCCLVQASGRADAAAFTRHPASASASRIVLSDYF